MRFEHSDEGASISQQRLRARSWTSTSIRTSTTFHRQIADGDRWQPTAIVEELKPKARAAGLWNLFLPESEYGAGLTNVEYAPLCEIMGRVARLRRRRCSTARRPTPATWKCWCATAREAQRKQWLEPLLAGKIRSCFAMTEPDVASSDATNIQSRIERDGDDYVINGRKWWTSGAGDPRCRIAIFMGKSDPRRRDAPAAVDDPRADGRARRDHPPHAAGVRLRRCAARACGITFEDVRVPASNMLLGEGRGFEIAQGRLGPGRIHHCMRLDRRRRACARSDVRAASRQRVAFGKPLAEQGTIRADIAESRMEIEQARLLTMNAAHLMDTVGNKAARGELAMVKVVVPRMTLRVLDRAIQAHGAAGVSDDFHLAAMWAHTRTIRLADGPDEVHREAIAKIELQKGRR